MNKILLLILFILMISISGKRGIKVFITVCLNFLLLLFSFYFISIGVNGIMVALISLILFNCLVLFYMNGNNLKTKASFISVLLVVILLIGILFITTKFGFLGGFGYEEFEEINMFSYDINFNMMKLYTILVLIGLVGAIMDTAVAISSSLYEININNPNLSRKELILSGFTVGKDILSTTTNTLLFAYFGEFVTLIIWFMMLKYSPTEIINSKVFASEYIKIVFSAIGCILIIPIVSIITTYMLKRENPSDYEAN